MSEVKPRLTARIARGLRHVIVSANVERVTGSGPFDDGSGVTAAEQKEIVDAIAWLDALVEWHTEKRKGKQHAKHT